jgi:TP901 family phage tail tape measure protein
MEQAGVQLIAQGAGAYASDLKNATNATDSFVRGTEQGGGKVNAASQIMIGALRQLGTIAVDAFAQAARAGADFLKDSVGLAGDFEAGMLKFQSVAGKDVDTAGLEKFHDLFIQIGKELPVSTSDVQKAAIEMVKGGIDPAIIAAGGLRQNIQFAAAAMDGDLVKAAEISSKILGGWTDANATAAEKTDFLAHSTDMLTKAANASSTDVEGLSRGIFNAQGIAKVAGVSFDDLTTTLAELAPRFASSSEAGNSLKNMIARLQPTTDPAIDAMESLGLYTQDTGSAFYDAQGNFVGFQQASQLLQESLKGLTKEQQAATLQQIFGNDAMGSAAALADLGAAGYQNMSDALDKANGVQATAALTQAGFNTALDNAKGSVEALQITIGEALLPVLTDLMNNTIAPAINTLTDMASALFGNEEAFNRLSPAAQSIVDTIKTLSDDIANIADAFDDAGAGSSEFGESIGKLADDLGLPGEQIQDIVFAAQDLVKWFNSTSSESNKLGGILTDLSGIWDHIKQVVTDAGAAYLDVADSILPQVKQFIADHGTEIKAFFQEAWDKIKEIVDLALQVYDDTVPPILHAVAGFIDDHGSEIQKIFKGAWDAISSIIDGALETIKTTLKLALDLIHGRWGDAWEDIKHIGETQAEAIKGAIKGFLDLIAGIFDTSLSDILDTWKNNWNMALDIVTKIDWSTAGASIVQGIIDGIESWAGKLFSTLEQMAQDAFDAFYKKIKGGSPAKEFIPAGESIVQGIMQGVSDTWPQLTDLVGSISDDLIDQMKSIGEDMQGVIADSFGATASIDRQIAQNLDKFKDVLPEYQQYTTGALKEAQNQAQAFLDPTEGAKFFQMRSKQILEYAKLQKDLDEAETASDRERITNQMALINAAQSAEIKQFDANTSAANSATDSIVNSINDVMKALSGIDLTDEQIHIVDMLSGVWSGLQAPAQTRADAYAHPPMMASQYPSSPPVPPQTSQRTFNMPIYTNQTPAALQQSLAIAEASMP